MFHANHWDQIMTSHCMILIAKLIVAQSSSTLAQEMAWYLLAQSHYLNQCWLIISPVALNRGRYTTKFYLGITHLKLLPHLPEDNSLWPSDVIWQYISGSTFAQIMACCLTTQSLYLDQSWRLLASIWMQFHRKCLRHYSDIIMSVMVSQITSLAIVYSTVYSGADQRKHQTSTSLAFVQGIHHRWIPRTKGL